MSKKKSMRITCVLLSAVGIFCLLTACGSESASTESGQSSVSESVTGNKDDHTNQNDQNKDSEIATDDGEFVEETTTPSQSNNSDNSQHNRSKHNSSKSELIAI